VLAVNPLDALIVIFAVIAVAVPSLLLAGIALSFVHSRFIRRLDYIGGEYEYVAMLSGGVTVSDLAADPRLRQAYFNYFGTEERRQGDR